MARFGQSAEATEYTDRNTAEGLDLPKTGILDMTLNSLMMRLR